MQNKKNCGWAQRQIFLSAKISHNKVPKDVMTDSSLSRFYEKFHGYNECLKKKKKAPVLDYDLLKRHPAVIWNLCNKPYASQWSFLSELETLAKSADSYASFLKSSNEVQLRNQALPYPVRQPKD